MDRSTRLRQWARVAFASLALVTACAGEGARGADDGGASGKADELDSSGPDSGEPAGDAAQFPIVLVHAFHATTSNSWSMARVQEVLEDEGHFAYLAAVPPYAGTPERAAALVDELDAAREAFCRARDLEDAEIASCIADTPVHIVGHSQGGLDARYAVGRLGYGEHTVSVTTLSAPHRGTPLGDVGLSLLEDPRASGSSNSILEGAVHTLFEHLLESIGVEGLEDAVYWLSEARFARAVPGAAEDMPDADGVRYFSWAGVATSSGALPDVSACEGKAFFPSDRAADLRGLHDAKVFGVVAEVFDDAHVPNDGHIPVASAKYGEFMGCVAADHLDLIGRPDDQVAGSVAGGFDYRAFYRALGQQLVEIEATP